MSQRYDINLTQREFQLHLGRLKTSLS